MDNREEKITIWNPHVPGYFDDPYEHLLKCQKYNPVQKGIHNEWIIFKYKDVKSILKSSDFITTDLSKYFISKEKLILKNYSGCPFLSKSTKKWMMYLDDHHHDITRSLTDKALKKFNFEEVVNNSLEIVFTNFKNKAAIDLVDLAVQIPTHIINSILGITGMASYDKFKNLSHALSKSQDLFVTIKSYQEINDEMSWIFQLFEDLCEEKKQRPDNSLISYFIELNDKESTGLTNDEIISLLMVIFMGAVETSKDVLSIIFLELLKNQKLIDYIKSASDIQVNILTEEFIRYASPLQYTIRINKNELKLDGHTIPPNSRIFLCLASANRDKTIFETPNEIVPDRNNNPHLSFGAGVHSCIGAKLARIELRLILRKAASFLEHYTFNDKLLPTWHKTIFMRGLQTLPVLKK